MLDLDKIINQFKYLETIQEVVINNLDKEMNFIILNNIIDDFKIENLFEQIINLFPCDKVENLLKKLGCYYYNVNSDLVKFYVDTYLEMYYDEEDYEKGKNKLLKRT